MWPAALDQLHAAVSGSIKCDQGVGVCSLEVRVPHLTAAMREHRLVCGASCRQGSESTLATSEK